MPFHPKKIGKPCEQFDGESPISNLVNYKIPQRDYNPFLQRQWPALSYK